jgi:Domain of unknown function (DUF4192)
MPATSFLSLLPDRAALAAELAPPAPTVGRLRRELDRAEQRFVGRVAAAGGIVAWRAEVSTDLAAARAGSPSGRSRSRSARLVVALLDGVVRDRGWLAVERGGPAGLPGWADLWRHLARHALPPYRAEPLYLLAWTVWRSGDRVTAGLVNAMVAGEDPAHRAAALLDQVLRLRLDPRRVPPLSTPRASRAGRGGGR